MTEHGATNGSPIPIEVSESNPILLRKVSYGLILEELGSGEGFRYTAEVEWMEEIVTDPSEEIE